MAKEAFLLEAMASDWSGGGFGPGKALREYIAKHPESYREPPELPEDTAATRWAEGYLNTLILPTLGHEHFHIPLGDGNRAEYVFGRQRRIIAPHDSSRRKKRVR